MSERGALLTLCSFCIHVTCMHFCPWDAMGGRAMHKRYRMLTAGGVVALAITAATAGAMLDEAPPADWRAGARDAALARLVHAGTDAEDVEFADVKVRSTGEADTLWVCGSVALWSEQGARGPYRDFWLTVRRVPGTEATILEVRENGFGRDDFLDEDSALYRACFAREAGTKADEAG